MAKKPFNPEETFLKVTGGVAPPAPVSIVKETAPQQDAPEVAEKQKTKENSKQKTERKMAVPPEEKVKTEKKTKKSYIAMGLLNKGYYISKDHVRAIKTKAMDDEVDGSTVVRAALDTYLKDYLK